MKPDPLQAVCDTSLFQDIFTQTLNSSIDIQTIQATLCSLNLSDIDALLNDIFKANGMIVQVSELMDFLVGGLPYQSSCIDFLHVF